MEMKVKWEKNSRSVYLAEQGKIRGEDIIPRTTTDNFPTETATVRLANVRAKQPFVTVHIRGKEKQHNNQYHSWNYATTMRVNLGGHHTEIQGVNGELDSGLTFKDVHSAVEEVKEAMDIK